MVSLAIVLLLFKADIKRIFRESGKVVISFFIAGFATALGAVSGYFLLYLGGWIGSSQYDILFVTLLTIVAANVMPKTMNQLEGEFELGMIFMYVFFAMVGASTDATAFADSAMNLFCFGILIILVHIGFVLLAARLLRIDLAEAIVASGACLVGPAPTAAIAITQGWRSLVTPGIMCGIFGYVIGTFLGVAASSFLNSMPVS